MKILLTAVGAVLLATAAVAGDVASKATAITFGALDKNADRQISRTEAAGEKALSDSFASVDTNGDGYVTEAEYVARTNNVEYTARSKP